MRELVPSVLIVLLCSQITLAQSPSEDAKTDRTAVLLNVNGVVTP